MCFGFVVLGGGFGVVVEIKRVERGVLIRVIIFLVVLYVGILYEIFLAERFLKIVYSIWVLVGR